MDYNKIHLIPWKTNLKISCIFFCKREPRLIMIVQLCIQIIAKVIQRSHVCLPDALLAHIYLRRTDAEFTTK
ncbi:MAG: hypothetical protein CSB34_05445 [Desulfobulbus propionicus]|nr:MAG: hypothetical protein CSB34_05445 [Desulfobulbus propionicus]PIE66016.1 MAG: hypothetical protein CSA26_02035 [Desulfobacterales bacterium]